MQQSPVAAVSIALAAGIAAFWYYQQSRTSAKQRSGDAVDEGWFFLYLTYGHVIKDNSLLQLAPSCPSYLRYHCFYL